MRRAALISAALLVTIASAQPAAASFHLMKIREVFVGTGGDPSIEYVVLQMYGSGQNLVAGHTLTFYNAAGASVGSATFAMDVAIDANQSKILIATTTAETFFSVTADLVMTAAMDPSGGMVCWEDIDCVSWGSYGGSTTNPSPSGLPFAPNGGISVGHAVVRDISHGNGSTLQDGDDTDDSFADFDCATTATPTNNAGSSGSYMDPSPCPMCGNNTEELGEVCDGTDDSTCPGGCTASCLCPSHDSVVLPLKPLKLKVPDDMPMSVSKTVKIKVRNADTHNGNDDISLTANSGTCPPGVSITTPDFTPPTMDNTVKLGAGASDTAQATVTVTAAAFTTFNALAISRCVLTISVATDVTGNTDPRPTNNTVPLELNVIDQNDPEQSSPPDHETYISSLKPLKVTVRGGSASKEKSVKPTLGNADILPSPDSGDSLTLDVDVSSCSGVSVTALDADRGTDGNQTAVTVEGGDKSKGVFTLSFAASGITTPNTLSPYRCVATVSAIGPSDPDPSPANNDSKLVIDIVDKNDL